MPPLSSLLFLAPPPSTSRRRFCPLDMMGNSNYSFCKIFSTFNKKKSTYSFITTQQIVYRQSRLKRQIFPMQCNGNVEYTLGNCKTNFKNRTFQLCDVFCMKQGSSLNTLAAHGRGLVRSPILMPQTFSCWSCLRDWMKLGRMDHQNAGPEAEKDK